MKAQLVKHSTGYILFDEKGIPIGATPNVLSNGTFSKLSLKNCQAIERGYDVYDLAKENYHKFWSVVDESEMLDHTFGYVEGFLKALEILGERRFTEEDVMLGWDAGVMSSSICTTTYYGFKRQEQLKEHRNSYKENLKPVSLQQDEWEVEVEMICPHPSDTYRCGIQYGCDEDGCNHPNQVPHLDADGCLILKRV